jgi:membrane protease YdiL (CAAX protease family)
VAIHVDSIAPLAVALCGGVIAAALLLDARRRRGAASPPLLPRATSPLPDTLRPLLVALLAWFGGRFVLVDLLRNANQAPVAPLEAFLAGSALHLVLAVALLRFSRHNAQFEGRAAPPSRAVSLALGAVTGLVAYSAVFVVGEVIRHAYAAAGSAPPVQDTVAFLRHAEGAELVLASVLAVVVAPLAEEVFFRGILFPAFARELPVHAALVVQAVLFGAIHVSRFSDAVFVVPLALVGWATGWIYLRTRSLGAAVLAHAVFNAIELGLFLALVRGA